MRMPRVQLPPPRPRHALGARPVARRVAPGALLPDGMKKPTPAGGTTPNPPGPRSSTRPFWCPEPSRRSGGRHHAAGLAGIRCLTLARPNHPHTAGAVRERVSPATATLPHRRGDHGARCCPSCARTSAARAAGADGGPSRGAARARQHSWLLAEVDPAMVWRTASERGLRLMGLALPASPTPTGPLTGARPRLLARVRGPECRAGAPPSLASEVLP